MAGNRAPTIYDVARSAGVAASTVSRALTRPGRVSRGTVARIETAAAELGYRTNPLARALPTGRTSMLALIVTDVTDPATAEMLRGAQEAAGEAGYLTVVADAAGRPEALDRALSTVDGAVLAAPHTPDDDLSALAASRPVVLLDRMLSGLPCVVPDIPDGMRRVVEHLAALGHDLVTYVAGPADAWADGMHRRALRQAGCEYGVQSRRIGPFPATVAGGLAAAGELLQRPTTAVIAYDDQIAIGLIRALTARGILVPQEISVTGFGNVPAAGIVTPGLTTVASPLRLMGAVGVRHLLGLIARPGPEAGSAGVAGSPGPVTLPVTLVTRGSTAHRRRNRGVPMSGGGTYLPTFIPAT
ncbi:LacI family DNA-binding transcriptional regulator [Actinoplanes sp. N902-109]|uniref:LacI family DNA-binding transcriptional regulator n=1 Tax=Actinoplanes sp. (strain N902-109) TaxID=649831 RepID=UPI0003294DCF|nr:LacI family DNA-binding transcriptional regulator [Actinoplanes sp. N902-109]AGL17973.1 LacI family transcriptional regulator [Actinoplanes sp. N902-109]